MQINWRKVKITLFVWYAWALMQFNSVLECIIFWSGLYLPLFIVDLVVQQNSLQYLTVDNDEKVNLQFFRIEYQVPLKLTGPTKLRYDITSRALWFLHFVGNNYSDFIEYVNRAIPWYDIHSTRFTDDAEIVFKYIIDPGNSRTLVKLTLNYNNQYFWEYYGVESINPPISYDVMFNMVNFLEPELSDSDSDDE